nr:hypothetical protein [Candidatus Freyarchaeota archaeon]
MKKLALLVILALTAGLLAPMVIQAQPVYAQPVTHTYTFSETVDGTQVDFNITVDLGVLIDGNIAGWFMRIYASSNDSLQSITINSVSNGTQISRGLFFPVSNAFESDESMMSLTPLNMTFTAVKYENVLLPENTAGLPSQTSFNLSVTIETFSGSKTVYLASDVPVISFVLPNPGKAPPEVNYYLLVAYLLAFLLPVSFVLVNRWLKLRKLKRESVAEV